MKVTPDLMQAFSLSRVSKTALTVALVAAFSACASSQPSARIEGLLASENFQAQNVSQEYVNNDQGFGAASFESFAQAELVMPSAPEQREVIVAGEIDGLVIKHSLDSRGEGFAISSIAASKGNFDVLRLNSPERLVIDLREELSFVPASLALEGSQVVSSVRLGTHPGKTRIVFDLLSESAEHELANDGDSLLVNFSAPVIKAQKVTASPLAEQEQVQLVELLAPENSVTARTDLALPEVPYLRPSTEEQPVLASLSIESLGPDQNIVVAQMTSGGAFTLQKTAPSEHILRLENASLEPSAAGALLAPPMSGHIRAVRPTMEGSDVLLRIFSSPNAFLKAESRGSRIVVTAAASPAEFRAQLAPEEASMETAAATAANGFGDEFSSLLDDSPRYTGRLISLDLQDTDIDNALRIIAEVSNLNIIASSDVTGKVTLRLIDVPWDQALDVILKTNGLDKVQEGNVVRIAPVEKLRLEREALRQARRAEQELEALSVRYIRISYAKAAELRPLVETVLTERGTVTYDDRTNQLIVKDIRSGIRNVLDLVARLDLRTPQVLLETQIVEASRNLLRDLGAELGFNFVRSPAVGNALGYNFPNAVTSAATTAFPAAVTPGLGSAVSMLFDSADGSRSLDARITALEQEGRVRVVSRPAVATTNNRPAMIKSVEKIRIRTPDGGLSVATGAGAQAAGASSRATETVEVGITLNVTPQASPDYFVLLDVDAKSSTFGAQVVDDIPSEVERSATSTVLVSSGQTFALGGIYRIIDSDSVSGVPFFKDIPFLGHLFRKSTVNNSDEELLFFITPRIIEGSFDDAAMRSAS